MTSSLKIGLLLLPVVGCGSAYRTEVVAQTSLAAVEPTSSVPIQAALEIPAQAADAYLLTYDVHLPRAMELAYEIRCPETEYRGVLGETFESYRSRRLAELEQQRRSQAELVGSLVGAVVPGVQAQSTVTTPGASASAQATVRPGEVATQAALQSLPPAALPPGDVGARTVHEELELGGSASGSCTFVLTSNVPGQDVSGASLSLTLLRRIDLAAEQQALAAAERARQAEAAQALRASLTLELEGRGATRRSAGERRQLGFDLRAALAAELVIAGADPGLRARERAQAEEERVRVTGQRTEEERLRLEARLAFEAQQRDAALAAWREREQRDAELREGAWSLRTDLEATLIGLGADPELRRRKAEERARLEAETQLQLERERRTAQERARLELQLGLELRADLSAELIVRGADPEDRQRRAEEDARARMLEEWATTQARLASEDRARVELDAAMALRVSLRSELLAAGAVNRPPRPAAPYEVRPAVPFEGAWWIDGSWAWSGATWVWLAGHYEAPGLRGALGIGSLGLGVEGTLSIQAAPVTVQVQAEQR